ncbi:MAG: septum formation initiator family protein [Magnetococcus sp. WYHC-3]
MNKLIAHSAFFRQNLLTLIGVCLCVYFSYHAVLGNRSLIKSYALEKQIETMSLEKVSVMEEQESLQKKVAMMRPGSVDRDMLEEQVRQRLGYRGADELVVLSN